VGVEALEGCFSLSTGLERLYLLGKAVKVETTRESGMVDKKTLWGKSQIKLVI